MKLYIIFLLLAASFIISCSPVQQPTVQKGVLDLRGWDFENDGLVQLNGKWEFYWDYLYTPEDFAFKKVKEADYIAVPSNWRMYCIANGIQYHAKGKATYRLEILLDTPSISPYY
jgi:hypothetical protein